MNSRSLDILRWPLWAVVFTVACAVHTAGAQEQPARIGPIRLRIEWSAAVSRTWNGVLEISDGQFASPISLGVEADEPGTLWIENDAVWIRRRSPRSYDGFDVELTANPAAVLTMTLQAPEDGRPGDRIQIRVGDLTSEERAWSLPVDQGRVTIRRRPGDNLVVHTTRPHLVFEPGETFDFQLALHPAQHWERPVKFSMDWELCRGRSTEPFLRGGQILRTRLNPAHPLLFPISVPLPAEEGVYDIHFKAQGRGMQPLASHIQVLVYGSRRPEVAPAATEKPEPVLVDQLEPASVPPERLIAAPNSTPVPEPARSSLLKFRWTNRPEAESPAAEEWQALRLKIRNPHRPHRVTLTLHREAQHLGASVLQPNASGQLMPVGIDSSIRVTEARDESSPAPQHEFTFWPNVNEPVLLCYSLLAGKSPRIERIDVHELPDVPANAIKPTSGEDRWTGLYLEKPTFVKALGANETLDPLTHRSLDDWDTFSMGTERLCQHLRRHGYNCLLLGSLADGSTLFPCPLLQPTPRYDTGSLFSHVQDPVRKDVLELMYRRCDREGFVLIPELQFSSPLPELEQAIREVQSRENGIELIGRDGRTWSESRGSDRGLAPRYNPLHPRVQEALTRVVQEVVSRYREHPSFQGLALELGGSTCMSFPSLDWGYDEPTVARFEKAMRIRIPYRDGVSRHQQRYEYLTTQVSREWVQWRAAELARFHLQLARIVTDAKPQARTIFTAPRLLRHETSRDHLDDLLKSAGALEQLLLTRGIDPNRYATPNVVLLRPQLWSGADSRLERAIDESVNSHPGLDNAFTANGQATGTLLYRRAHERRLDEFDALSPWQPAFTWLAPAGAIAGPEGRKSAVHALAALDAQMLFDGSWTLPFGTETATQAVRQTVRFLPAVRFHTITSPQPAVVRIAHARDSTYVYVVNDSAGATRVTLHLTCPATTNLETPQGTVKLRPNGDTGSQLTLELAPYDVQALRLNHPRTEVSHVESQLAEASRVALLMQLESLEKLAATVREKAHSDQEVLQNAGFEFPANRQRELKGWEVSHEKPSVWVLDPKGPHSGSQSLCLKSANQPVSLATNPIKLTEGRCLTLTVWMRSDSPNCPVQLVFEADPRRGEAHRLQAAVSVGPQWQRYLFRVRNLPANVSEGRVRVEFAQGQLWVDDVEAHFQRATPDDLRQLTKTFSATRLAWEEGRFIDCQRLLDGYWGQFLLDDAESIPTVEQAGPPLGRRLRDVFRR